jgi:chromate transporter
MTPTHEPHALPGPALPEPAVPRLSLAALFVRFLRFGGLAWGGPIAQIAMLKKELVEEERWVSVPRFQRALAVYQALPGPEAHELCVWFGMLARGRVGAVLAGLGFMLPGLVLMLALAWLYVHGGLAERLEGGVLRGMQVAVLALIVRGVERIGRHALTRPTWWIVAVAAFLGALADVPFGLLLGGAAVVGLAARAFPDAPRPPAPHEPTPEPRELSALLGALAAPLTLVGILLAAALVGWGLVGLFVPPATPLGAASGGSGGVAPALAPTALGLFLLGLKAGLLTFGGAYTAIPFVRHDAVTRGGWLSDTQFLDGLALSGVLPAPMVIFTTFVGFLGADLAGGLAMTAGMFLPAFGFTLLGHELFERLTTAPRLHDLLDAVTAAVVGLIAATAYGLVRGTLLTPLAWLVFGLALLLVWRWRSRWATPSAVLLGALLGPLLRG